jgi:RNA polymerase sigma-70 factor (ECF subfamily)
MRDLTLSDIDRLDGEPVDAAEAFAMDEESFRAFYDRTAKALWAYLSRASGDSQLADDLLQETYYRFLRAKAPHESEAHRRNYLFRIATNLITDGRRRAHTRPRIVSSDLEACETHVGTADPEGKIRQSELAHAMARLKPRERELLWLAYGQGSSHREIADALGVKCGSIKLLLFRARRKLAALLRERPARMLQPEDRRER